MRLIRQTLVTLATLLGLSSPSWALTIAPTVPPSAVAPSCTGPGTGADPDWIATYCPAMSGLTEQYKQNEGNPFPADTGSLAGSYTTVFNGDLSGGSITWDGGAAVSCGATSSCWLLVKDGNATPGRYAFNLTSVWNGTETINLEGFWAGVQGSISHIALYSKEICTRDCGPNRVPEPGTVALMALALLGLGVTRRRRG